MLCSTDSETCHDLVPLCHQVFNRVVQVREDLHDHTQELFDVLEITTCHTELGGRVIDEIRCNEVIDGD